MASKASGIAQLVFVRELIIENSQNSRGVESGARSIAALGIGHIDRGNGEGYWTFH